MAYKCRICGSNDVENPGDVCELCAIGQDPYASAIEENRAHEQTVPDSGHVSRRIQVSENNNAGTVGKGRSRKVLINGGSPLINTDPYGNQIESQSEQTVQVYHAGEVPQQTQAFSASNVSGTGAAVNAASKGKEPITSGITRNIAVDTQQRPFLQKWFKSLFSGIPLTMDDDIIMFQVFPDYSGTSLNAMGNACDQVIVYGKVSNGAIAENNEVEIYGKRDSNNNVIAAKIINKASGTTVVPDRTISAAVVWVVTIAIFALIAGIFSGLGVYGVLWAGVLLICLTNLPRIAKIISVILGVILTVFKHK